MLAFMHLFCVKVVRKEQGQGQAVLFGITFSSFFLTCLACVFLIQASAVCVKLLS